MDGQKGHQTSMKDEQLQEQYEDALFALLMDELAKRQGAEYSRENEALKQDAAFAVPERTYQRCLRVIRRGFAGRRFKKAGKIALLAIRKLSVAVFTLLVLFGAAIAASPRLQSSTLRFLVYFDAKGTTIEARPEENAAYVPDGTLKVQVGWIPDGFALTEEWEAEIGFEYTYRSADDRCVYVNVSGGVGTASIDTEDAQVTDIEIHGCYGIMSEKPGQCIIMWADQEHDCVVIVGGEGVDRETVMRIAEGVQIER